MSELYERKKVLVAMSGGVDSSAAVKLAADMGFEVGGAIMRLWDKGSTDVEDARNAAQKLNIPFYLFDLREEFEKEVVDKFVDTYLEGATPNPCVFCNKKLKFDKFLSLAEDLSYSHIATGHYVRKEFDKKSGRWLLKRSPDSKKDQSYVLYSLTQSQLERTIFPCGELSKEQIRGIAIESGLVNANKPDSQDICFIPDGDYASFIENRTGKISHPGEFVLSDGRVLGQHNGLIRYTVGQRKGLGISYTEPLFVIEKDMENNRVILGTQRELFRDSLICKDVNFIPFDKLNEPMEVTAQTRYHQPATDAVISPVDDGRVLVEFKEPKRAISKGQAVVFYTGDYVVGGGTIE